MQYIEKKIGEDYLNWDNADIILINAPTGSGKTQFCLRKLLCKRAIWQGEKILYLVNRRILQEQLLEDIRECEKDLISNGIAYISLKDYITVCTYQELEGKLTTFGIEKSIEMLQQYQNTYSMIIYDECHYFYADSNFNTYTQLSYDFLTHCFNEKIQIFMSATMGRMKSWIETHIPKYGKEQQIIGYNPLMVLKIDGNIKGRVKEYNCEKDYSYINLNILDRMSDIEKTIINGKNGKWLIFVDNKELGKKLRDCLIKSAGEKIEEKDIIYIDAEYSKDAEAVKTVDFLALNKKIPQKIVITTAVMDNGISFHDEELRNLIILADTEEEFIQMLGRKRKDNQNVNVYFCKRDEKHFQKRLQMIERRINSYMNNAEEIGKNYYWTICDENFKFKKYEFISPFTLYREYYWQYKNKQRSTNTFGDKIIVDFPQSISQQKFLKSILESPEFYNNTRGYIYYHNGLAAINELSLKRLFDLKSFYQSMIEKCKINEWAFAKEVMYWLGYSKEKISEKIKEGSINLDQEYRNRISEILRQYEGKILDSEDNKKLKQELLDDLIHFLQNSKNFETKEISNIQKKDRTLSEDIFNKIMKEIGLVYTMEKPDRSHFEIKRKPNN